jgi:hypothetical protein
MCSAEIMVPTHLASFGTRDSQSRGSGSRSGTSFVSGQRMQPGGVRVNHFASSQVSLSNYGKRHDPFYLKSCNKRHTFKKKKITFLDFIKTFSSNEIYFFVPFGVSSSLKPQSEYDCVKLV